MYQKYKNTTKCNNTKKYQQYKKYKNTEIYKTILQNYCIKNTRTMF